VNRAPSTGVSTRPNVVAFLPRRGAFAEARHPSGVPGDLSRSTDVISHAAAAIAELAGEDLERITPERLDEFRQWALLAATLAHPDGRMMAAYHVERARLELERRPPGAFEVMGRDARLAAAHRILVSIRAAARFIFGVGSPLVHDQVAAQLAADGITPVPMFRPSRLDV
jgi:hypothetical protein